MRGHVLPPPEFKLIVVVFTEPDAARDSGVQTSDADAPHCFLVQRELEDGSAETRYYKSFAMVGDC